MVAARYPFDYAVLSLPGRRSLSNGLIVASPLKRFRQWNSCSGDFCLFWNPLYRNSKTRSESEKAARAVLGAGVEIFAGGGDGGVAEGGLHQMNRGAAVEGMGTVRVPHPVRRNI